MESMKGSILDFSNINPLTSGLMMTSVIFGSAVILMPGVVFNLGAMSFVMLLFWCLSLFYYSDILACYFLGSILIKTKPGDDTVERRPLQHCCQVVFGKQSYLTLIVSIFQMLSITTIATSFFLVMASTLNASFPSVQIDSSVANTTRLWIFIVFILVLPLHMIGNYKSMTHLGTLTTSTIFLAMIMIFVTSIIIRLSNIPLPNTEDRVILQANLPLNSYNEAFVFFSSFGTIVFTAAGYMLTLPNIALFMPDVQSLNKTLSFSIVSLFLLYSLAGYVPYFLLKDYVVETSILTTLQRIANTASMTSLNLLCRSVEILLLIHYGAAAVICLNPLHLICETIFNVPNSK